MKRRSLTDVYESCKKFTEVYRRVDVKDLDQESWDAGIQSFLELLEFTHMVIRVFHHQKVLSDEELMEQIKERERLIEDPTLSNALREEGIAEVETLRELLYYRKLASTYMNA